MASLTSNTSRRASSSSLSSPCHSDINHHNYHSFHHTTNRHDHQNSAFLHSFPSSPPPQHAPVPSQQPQDEPESPPLLLLEGDKLHVSPEGVARSVYQLVTTKSNEKDAAVAAADDAWTIEEHFHLLDSSKSFFLREPHHPANTITRIDIQEIDTRQVGTGGTTWEASMVMALYFARHPDQLQGNVVELGSGVGLGGIWLHHVTQQQHSLTLTDGCPQVVRQCETNVLANSSGNSNLTVMKLDWNQVLRNVQCQDHGSQSTTSSTNKYNTVLACDCAYRSRDVPGLTGTLKALLISLPEQQQESNSPTLQNQIHLFGPYNRSTYHEVIECLEQDDSLEVQIECIDMNRYRLEAGKPSTSKNTDSVVDSMFYQHQRQHHYGYDPYNDNRSNINLEEELQHASRSCTKFLHVSASFKSAKLKAGQGRRTRSVSLSDID